MPWWLWRHFGHVKKTHFWSIIDLLYSNLVFLTITKYSKNYEKYCDEKKIFLPEISLVLLVLPEEFCKWAEDLIFSKQPSLHGLQAFLIISPLLTWLCGFLPKSICLCCYEWFFFYFPPYYVYAVEESNWSSTTTTTAKVAFFISYYTWLFY